VGQKPAFFVTLLDSKAKADRTESAMTGRKDIELKIESLVNDELVAMGYELVRVELMTGGHFPTLQVMAERADRKPMTVEDCVTISRTVSLKLENETTIAEGVTLEVSSPGIDRPLIRLQDFERFAGHLARVELNAPQNGVKRFKGSIIRITGNPPDAQVEFHTEQGDWRVPLAEIARAKLVLTEALLNAGTKH
jgi:ribosome maturation factor RimP